MESVLSEAKAHTRLHCFCCAGAALITAHKCHKCDSLKPLLVIMQKVCGCENGWVHGSHIFHTWGCPKERGPVLDVSWHVKLTIMHRLTHKVLKLSTAPTQLFFT
jgi:hypothetical protein